MSSKSKKKAHPVHKHYHKTHGFVNIPDKYFPVDDDNFLVPTYTLKGEFITWCTPDSLTPINFNTYLTQAELI